MTGIQIAGLAVLAVFYAAYFFKMFLQRRHASQLSISQAAKAPHLGASGGPVFLTRIFVHFRKLTRISQRHWVKLGLRERI